MTINRTASVIALVALTGQISPAFAGAENRLGKLMALPVMAQFCHLEIPADQKTQIDELGPKLQKESGLSDEQVKDVLTKSPRA